MAGNEPTRRRRVPCEWILGSGFVATFCVGPWYEDFFLGRALWLLLALPLACVGFGVARTTTDPKPRSGWLPRIAAFGWLYLGAMLSAVDAKHSMGESARDVVMTFFMVSWPAPPALCVACLIAVAREPRKYRDLATFSVAATLLAYAWLFDLILSCKGCYREPPKPAPLRETAALVLTLAPLAWALGRIGSAILERLRGRRVS